MPPRRKTVARGPSSSRRRRRSPTPPPPPSPLPWALPDHASMEHYIRLHKRTVVPSKFFDPYTIHNLGLRDEVNMFVNRVGWVQFAGLNFPTYKSITYEILSTLRSTYQPHIYGDPLCIYFQCMGEERQLTISQFNGIFGFPNAGIAWNSPEFNPEQAWNQLTGLTEYNPRRSKSRHIRNHALRYIHRVMALSLFGRYESTGVVSRAELMILWAMTNEVEINTGAWLLRHLLHTSKVKAGRICVGGILSIIADAFGFVPVEGIHPQVTGSTLVDMDTLTNMHMCRHIGGGQYRLLDDEGHVIQPDDDEEAAEEEGADDPLLGEEQVPAQEQAAEEEFQQPPPEPHQEWRMQQLIERFDRMDARFDRIDARFDQYDARFESMDARMARSEEIQLQMQELMRQNAEVNRRIEDRLANWK